MGVLGRLWEYKMPPYIWSYTTCLLDTDHVLGLGVVLPSANNGGGLVWTQAAAMVVMAMAMAMVMVTRYQLLSCSWLALKTKQLGPID